MTPPKDQDSDPFLSNPLCASLLNDPSYTHSTYHASTPESPNKVESTPHPKSTAPTYPNPFFNRTVRTHSAVIKASFLSKPFPAEGHLLLHLGPGVTGQDGIAHGGFLAVVMDEVCGCLISSVGVDGGVGMFTGRLSLGYVRPVFVKEMKGGDGKDVGATVVIATARVERVEGRKVFVGAVIRDADGEVCTTAEAIFVKRKGPGEAVL